MSVVIDLTLAVNYLPACACLGKMILFMLALAAIPDGAEVRGGYLVIGAILYMDRMLTRNIIFDANAILLAVFLANIHAAIRTGSTTRAYPVFVWGLHVCWMNTCVLLIAEPAPVRRALEKRTQASKVVPVVMMLVIYVATAYLEEALEPGALRACRALGFTLMAFAWIYVVGIHNQLGIEYLKDTSCQFVARLAPVLYSPPWLAALFCPAVIWALVTQHMRLHRNQQASSPYSYQPLSTIGNNSVVVVATGVEPILSMTEEPSEKLEELFRQAKAAQISSRGKGMDTIQEMV